MLHLNVCHVHVILPCYKLCWQAVNSICDEDVFEKQQIYSAFTSFFFNSK